MRIIFVFLGDLICNLFYLLPLPHMVRAYSTDVLPQTPFFYSIAFFNTTIWTTYALVARDPWILASDLLGLLLTFYYFNIMMFVVKEPQRTQIMLCNHGQIVSVSLACLYVYQYGLSYKYAFAIMGDIWSTMMLWSPIVDVYNAILQRDPSIIFWPISLLTLVNSTLWIFYGLWIDEFVIWMPSILTAASGAIQLLVFYLLHVQGPKSLSAA